jgi:protein TonB
MVTGRYAFDGYKGAHGIRPGSALAALGLSAAMVSGLIMSSPEMRKKTDTILELIPIALEKPKPEPVEEVKPIVATKLPPVVIPKPLVPVEPVALDPEPFTITPISGPASGSGTGLDPITILPPQPTPTPMPVLTRPQMDARYARDFQPPYPPSEQRAGREGLVSVRVLIGADGRVKQIEKIAAASDAFWAVTERQALTRWRFRPATRDGVAMEAWREMTVRFEMPE